MMPTKELDPNAILTSVLGTNSTEAERDEFNKTLCAWLDYTKHNESCILDLLPNNFQSDKFYFIGGYLLLLIFGAIENVSALRSLLANTRRKVANTLLLVNLTIANMIVTFAIIPIEIIWRITLSWPTGELGCKFLQTVRALGPYLSSMGLMGISLDRYSVLTRPFNHRNTRRTRFTLVIIWFASLVLSSPQSVIFKLERHPICYQFIQCVPIFYFETEMGLKTYNLLSLAALYAVPLAVIIYCYVFIILALHRQSEELQRFSEASFSSQRFTSQAGSTTPDVSVEVILSRQGVRALNTRETRSHSIVVAGRVMRVATPTSQRPASRTGSSTMSIARAAGQMSRREIAYRSTIKKTLIIIVAFILCWAPFVLLRFLGQVAPRWANMINPYVKDLMLMFAVSNSCVNPLVYGTHTSIFKKLYWKISKRLFGDPNLSLSYD